MKYAVNEKVCIEKWERFLPTHLHCIDKGNCTLTLNSSPALIILNSNPDPNLTLTLNLNTILNLTLTLPQTF